MNFNLKVLLLGLSLVMAFGCGSDNKLSKSSSSSSNTSTSTTTEQNALLLNNGMQVAVGASQYIGHWEGYMGQNFATFDISQDGSVVINTRGKAYNEKLAKNSQGRFYISNTAANQFLAVVVYGSYLTLTSSDRTTEYTFTKTN